MSEKLTQRILRALPVQTNNGCRRNTAEGRCTAIGDGERPIFADILPTGQGYCKAGVANAEDCNRYEPIPPQKAIKTQ